MVRRTVGVCQRNDRGYRLSPEAARARRPTRQGGTCTPAARLLVSGLGNSPDNANKRPPLRIAGCTSSARIWPVRSGLSQSAASSAVSRVIPLLMI